MSKEANARIKINKLLEEAGWRFFDSDYGLANIILESNTSIKQKDIDAYGDDFEKVNKGFIDFLLLDERGFPFVVLEAKAEHIHPLAGKEQARKYAKGQNCRFIILSNGNSHYFWDTAIGSPRQIQRFPTQAEVSANIDFKPDTTSLTSEIINSDYIALTINPTYKDDPNWQENKKLPFLRKYQIRAVEAIKKDVKKGKDRFLFEMATGTGKTLTSAAVIKLFLRTGNAKRVLFLVDRLELETQAQKAFERYLKPDYTTVVYKEKRNDWRKAEIVVSTVQSFTKNNKYKRIFAPSDFDLVISDEAHRSIAGNSRAVFEYFIGYKLGLTATPKDYLKKIDAKSLSENDPREMERRLLLDTYNIFGCDSGEPTYRYSLLDGVKDGFLVNPKVVDARTEITTQLLSDEGYSVVKPENDEGEEQEAETEDNFFVRDFEKKFFSENTNRVFCETFIKNALPDPVTGEVGKTIIFCVSQNHASKITQILNEYADTLFPGKYDSDFAMQVTSFITDAKQYTINFTNNNLSGNNNFNDFYKTSKTRVCCTVGMMTTGYDCPDLLNLCLMRPIFSPSDFVQIKGRGTRKHNFLEEVKSPTLKEETIDRINAMGNEHPSAVWIEKEDKLEKNKYKLFDFFANCEFFEEKFDYDEVLQLPAIRAPRGKTQGPMPSGDAHETYQPDFIRTIEEEDIGFEGMRIDRMYFNMFEEEVKDNLEIAKLAKKEDFDAIEAYIVNHIFDKPQEYYNLDKLRRATKVDRRLSLREIVEKIFGYIPYFKSKDELLEEEFEKFDSRVLPDEQYFIYAKNFFKSYITDSEFREIIENKNYALLNTNPNGEAFRKLPSDLREKIPEYIKDYVSLNRFMA
ncbi:MAG TPA: DEAD/DEAH box helicase family protein [Flavipsychrobacter sp.]|nr:DEAD/DEAH box helicase family protein [Flavipsychrobacter sp.]